MFVSNRMSGHVLTVTEDTPVLEATQIMRENNIRRLPVVKNNKLIGIVTEADLLRVSPSSATALSVFELNYLLSKLLIKEAMTKNPFTVTPQTTLEEAALLMRDKDVGALPVVDEGKLVGIITESDVFDAFIELMGLKDTGTRVTIDTEDRIGVLAEVTEIIKSFGVNIISLAALHKPEGTGEVVLRLDTTETDSLLKELENKGYKVVHVTALS